MNEGISYEAIRERLEFHSTGSFGKSLEEFDFISIFPEVSYHMRGDSEHALRVGDWFHVEANIIRQITAYGNSPALILLLIEPILTFPENVVSEG